MYAIQTETIQYAKCKAEDKTSINYPNIMTTSYIMYCYIVCQG